MTISNQDIERRLQLGEDSDWEFKQIEFRGNRPVNPKPDDLASEMVAFANAEGGNLLCGVTDDGQVQDMSPAQLSELSKTVTDISLNQVKPPIQAHLSHRISPDGKWCLLVQIPRGESSHKGPKGAYIRIGDSKQKINSDELLRLAQKRGQARFRWFDGQPVPGTGFQTLDENLWKPLLSAESARDPELGLEKMQFLAQDGQGVTRATVTGILICNNTPETWLPNAKIDAALYRGSDQASGQLDARTFGGPVNSQIEGVLSFAQRNTQVAARKEPGRIDMPQYSEKALFEAVVNAVAHRDYSIQGSRIRVLMFEDRIEICSPGTLPKNLALGGMSDRQSTRNETLVSALGRMYSGNTAGSEDRTFFMERRGDGVRIIQRETRKLSGKLPEYRLIDGSELHLVIPAASLEATPASVVITAHHGDRPISGVEILALFPNHTWKQAVTDEQGEAVLDLHSTHLPMTVFAAADGYAAYLEHAWMPADRALAMELNPLPDGGSEIFPEAAGNIPGLTGRLDPIRDSLGRSYLYALSMTINQGQSQPVYFLPDEDLRLTDANGKEKLVRIVDIQGRSALLEHRPFQKTDGMAPLNSNRHPAGRANARA